MQRIRVAAGILQDGAGRVLISQRRCAGAFDGLWEFPGGKIDAGESAEAALRRELKEELGIVVGRVEPYLDLDHDYPGRRVALQFFLVKDWQGTPAGVEGQALRWMDVDMLDAAELLPADAPLVAALQVAEAVPG